MDLAERGMLKFLIHRLIINFESRALRIIKNLTQDIGPRPFGTENNKKAVKYIVDEIDRINNTIIYSSNSRLTWRVSSVQGKRDFRRFSGYYESMDNVIAILRFDNHSTDAGDPTKKTIMISSHYDTVTASPGAFDDASGVAVGMELLEILALNEALIENKNAEIIFLFNNAEELGLIGAHDFSVDPKVKVDNIDGFINLDSTPGDKAMLTRTTGSWIDYHLRRVKRPLGFVLSADIYESGLIPSDTDFTVYKQHMSSGLDFSYYSKRHTYHTTKDIEVKPGSIQYLGDNILSIIQSIYSIRSQNEEITSNHSMVYFSILDSSFTIYTKHASVIIYSSITALYLIIFLLAIFVRYRVHTRYFASEESGPIINALIGFGYVMLTIVLTLGIGFGFAVLFDRANRYFSYANLSLSLFTFMLLSTFIIYLIQGIINHLETRVNIPKNVQRERIWFGYLIFTFILLLFSSIVSKSIGSVYILFLYATCALVSMVAYIIGNITNILIPMKESPISVNSSENTTSFISEIYWIFLFLICTTLPVIIIAEPIYAFLKLSTSFMSSGLVGLVVCVAVLLLHIPWMFIQRGIEVKKSRYFFILLGIILIATIIMAAASVSPPNPIFTKDRPYKIALNNTLDEKDVAVLTLRSITKHPSKTLKNFIEGMNLEWKDMTCNNNDESCIIRDAPPPNYAFTHTIDKVQRDGYTIVTVSLSTPKELFHTLSFNHIDQIEEVIVNGRLIDSIRPNFSVLLKDFGPWQVIVKVNGNVDDVILTLETSSTDFNRSPAFVKFLQQIPEDVAVMGTAIGDINKVYKISFL